MTVHASQAAYYPDAASDVTLRSAADGYESGEGQILEAGVLIAERWRAPQLVLGVLHVARLNLGAAEVWIDLLSLPTPWSRGDTAHVLCRYAIHQTGQRRIGFDSADVPVEHEALACRLLMLGGDGSSYCGYGLWLNRAGAA